MIDVNTLRLEQLVWSEEAKEYGSIIGAKVSKGITYLIVKVSKTSSYSSGDEPSWKLEHCRTLTQIEIGNRGDKLPKKIAEDIDSSNEERKI